MSVDVRFRVDGERPPFDAEHFFDALLPDALTAQRDRIAPGAAALRLRPLSLETPSAAATITWSEERGAASVTRGVRPGGCVRWRLSDAALCELARDEKTPMAFFSAGELSVEEGGLPDLLNWWLVLRAALDARPIHTPGAVRFRARDGAPLCLSRCFTPDDDPAEIHHFLREAGFLHLRGFASPERMARISRDMDAAAADYRDGDGKSWWVTTRDGARRLVRMQGFDARSQAAAELLEDPTFQSIGGMSGDGHVHTGLPGNRCEGLFKPIGVTRGISDVPWHKDCSLGRHSYECSSLTVGVSVTGAGPGSGQLRVRPGSHRALVWPAIGQPGLDLPDHPLPTETADLTVHLSCTLHMAQPPRDRERRVLYTSFRLPDRSEAAARARLALRAVREKAPVTVSQEPADR